MAGQFNIVYKLMTVVIITSLFCQSTYHAASLLIDQITEGVQHNVNVAPLEQEKEVTATPAADVNTLVSQPSQKLVEPKKKVTYGEDISKRTEYSKTIVEKNGKTKKQISLVEPFHYKKNGKWEKLNPEVEKNDQTKSVDLTVGDLVMKAKPLNKGIEYTYKGEKFSVTAKNASGVMPKLSKIDGKDVVLYENVFPSVDIKYLVSGYSIKEYIVLKDKAAQPTFDFVYKGIKLKNHSTIKGALAVEGLPDNSLYIAPLNISTSKAFVTDPVISQENTDSTVTIKVDPGWLQGLANEQFPVEIDPTWKTISKRPQDMMAVRSDGYRCGSNICSPTVGVEEYPNYYAAWRTLVNIPFDELKDDLGVPGAISARLQLVQNGGVWDDLEVTVSPAGCWDYNCAINDVYTFESPNSHWVDVSNVISWMNRNGMRSSPLILHSAFEGMTRRAVKTFDLSQMILEVTYLTDTRPPTPTPVYPLDKKVVSNLQPTLTVNPVTDPDGEEVRYVFCLMSDPKNYITCNTSLDPHWTVPDGLLNDGVTYYWYAEPVYGQATPPPTNLLSFKVDLRLGKDSTQSYDTAGPASVDLATGNLSTSLSSHSLKTLGGDLGVSLDYNTPAVSRPGLVAEYWNNTEMTGEASATTVVPTVDSNWRNNSPLGYYSRDNFSARYSGYLTVPETGNYVFGVKNDDQAKVYVNDQLIAEGAQCCDTTFGQAVALIAGHPAKIKVEYVEQTGDALVQLVAKSLTDPADVKVVDRSWLHTGIKATSEHGLVGDYYSKMPNDTFPSTQPLVSVREPDLDFENNGGLTGRVPGGVITSIARYRGMIEVPSTGSYKFSAVHFGGMRLKINNQTVIDNWQRTASYSEATNEIQLTKDQRVPIEVEYFDDSFNRPAKLSVQIESQSMERQTIPSTWLSRGIDILPSGWKLGATGDTANFDRLSVNNSSVTLSDSSGSTHEYKWENNAFVPPSGEHGILNRNTDGTYTFKDEDGRVYLFSVNGNLTSMTAPTDDKKPTAVKYTYSGSPARLTKISDGVNANRYAVLYYAGINDTNGICNPPSGWDAAPAGFLCKVQTSDGTFTALRYKSGNLARLEGAGSSMTDFGYDSMKRITQVRDPLASDALRMGVRTTSDFTTFDVAYDDIGRVDKITYPASTPGATRMATTYKYLVGATESSQVGASQPNGYSQRVEYDDAYRTTRLYGADGLASVTQWDPAKDIVLSTTDPLGLKSTTIYDANDRPIAKYGPAPAGWFGADNIPTAANLAATPRNETNYDEGMQGLSAAYFDNKHLVREPKARTFERGSLMRQWTSANRPVTTTTEGWGAQLTGEAILPDVGQYTFKLYSDDGVKLYIDDRLYINDWTDGEARYHEPATFDTTEANKRVKLRIEYYDKDQNDTNSKLELRIYKPGGATEEQAIQTNQYLVPNFSLPTSESATDSTLGKVTSVKTYNRPEYGVLDKISVDPGYFNYTSTTTTETPGAGFFRQTSKTLPGGNKTNYQYYASYDTKDDPCTPETEAAIQAGMPKGKTEPDPDGAGPQTSQTSEMIYDKSGQVVAARINDEPYTCTKYDSRGRVLQTITPTFNGRPGMTSTTNYSAGGNPLKVATTDSNGTVTTELDLLGRVIKYTDAYGKVTTPTYDTQGRITAKSSPIGAETFSYDNLDRLTNYAINGVVMAKPYYDSFSRVKAIDYPASNQKLISLEYDTLLRVKAMTWKLGDGTVVKESQAKSSTGLVVSNSRTIGTETLNQSFTYDKAARLRAAKIGTHTMSYNFDTPPASCGGSYNPLSHRNANRTSQVIDGVTTTYCYDFADRLISSSDANYNNPIYDDRGNITQIGSTDKPIKFSYDQANRNIRTEQRDAGGNGTITEYKRDAGGRMLARKEIKLTNNTESIVSNVRYGYTTGGDSPDMIMDMGGGMIQRSLSLPGGVMLALNANSDQAKQRTYSIPNFHGDTMVTTDYNGNKTGVFTYDPFGNQLDAVVPPQLNAPQGLTYGYLGANARPTETPYSIPITQMGDRIYLPGLGRFMQPDPVEGGNANTYIYPADPVNGRDLDGNFAWFAPVVWFVVTAVVSAVVAHVAKKVIDKVVPPPYRAPAKTAVTIASFASGGGAARAAVTKAPVYVPKIQKVVKNVFGGGGVKHTVPKDVNFAIAPAKHMEEAGRYVPVQILKQAIESGTVRPDLQGSKAMMHTVEMWKNGKKYQLEVLYDKEANLILHFVYRKAP